jgi:hypothetical protein
MDDDNIVSFKPKVIDWLVARTTNRADYSFSPNIDTVEGDGWNMTIKTNVGKFRNWCFIYEIEIEDDTIAVEFALVKDSF